jgi:hypothetical protein
MAHRSKSAMQLVLFDTSAVPAAPFAAVTDEPRRQPNKEFILKHLQSMLRLLRSAEILPWSEAETRNWEQLVPELTGLLGAAEGETIRREFEAQLARIRSGQV